MIVARAIVEGKRCEQVLQEIKGIVPFLVPEPSVSRSLQCATASRVPEPHYSHLVDYICKRDKRQVRHVRQCFPGWNQPARDLSIRVCRSTVYATGGGRRWSACKQQSFNANQTKPTVDSSQFNGQSKRTGKVHSSAHPPSDCCIVYIVPSSQAMKLTSWSYQHVPPPGAAETMPGDLAPPRKSHVFDRLQSTPKDMSEGIRTPKRQHSSRFDISDQRQRELEKLPGFHEVLPNRRQDLFMQKIDQCNIIFDFNDPTADIKSKEIKRLALHELLDYVANNRAVITEPMYPRVVDMFARNLFRPIPPPMTPQGEAFDPEEDEPVLEVAWPHIQVVYEFFLRFIESQDFNTNVAKAFIDHRFVLQVCFIVIPCLRITLKQVLMIDVP